MRCFTAFRLIRRAGFGESSRYVDVGWAVQECSVPRFQTQEMRCPLKKTLPT